MKVKNVNLEWKVMLHDFNTNKIKEYNVFSKSFEEELYKEIKKKKITNYEELKKYIRRQFMYHYWCKAEFEISVGGLLVRDINKDLTKIDVYTQLEMNLDRIVEYVMREMRIEF